MIHRTLSTRNDQAPYDIPSSKRIPVRPLQNNFDSVFKGTVASRIHQLQGHPVKKYSGNRQNEQDSSRESLNSRFGHRLAKNFSQPAKLNAKSSEEIRDEGSHSYSGIGTSYISIDKRHGFVSARKRQGSYDKKIQVENLAPIIRIQNDEPSPCIDSYEIASRSIGVTRISPDVDALLKEHSSTKNQIISANSISTALPDLSNDNFGKLNHKEEINLRKRGSDSSISTTSTTRRRNVRELFTHHGITRPAGLASSVKTHDTVGQNNQDSGMHCQKCSWTSKHDSTLCYNCKHYFDSQFPPTENQISSAGSIKKFQNYHNGIQTRLHPELDSASLIRKSQGSRPISIHPTEILPKGDMKSDKNNNLSRKLSQNLKSQRSTIGISNKKKDFESTNPAPFLSGTNVTKNVKNSPFFARDGLGITSLDQSHSRVAAKKMSCGSLQPNSKSSQSMDPMYIPLRHYNSLSKTHQNRYQIDPKSERLTKKFHLQKSIPDIKINPRHEFLQCYPANLISKRYVPNIESLSTQNEKAIEKSCVETDYIIHSLSANSLNGKEIDSSTTCDEIPTVSESTDGLGVLSRAKSVLDREAAKSARPKSISSADTQIFDNNLKQAASSSGNNKDLEEKIPGLSKLFHSDKDVDSPSKPVIGLPRVNITLDHQARSAVGQEISAKGDNETMKQRRIKIARRIKQSIPKSMDQKKDSLETQDMEYQSDSNSYLTGISTSELSKQLIAGRRIDLSPINYRKYPSRWKRSSDVSLTDIAVQEIKGVTVTLQLEGRDDMVFRTKPSEVDISKNF